MAVSTIPNGKLNRSLAYARQFPGTDPLESIGFISTFPPTRCGLATFTASLAGVLSADVRIGVVSCVDAPGRTLDAPEVVAEWVRGSFASRNEVRRVLNHYDAVIVQHEFGVFGGADGSDIVDLITEIDSPVIVVLHTVLETPSANQRRIVEKLGAAAHKMVVQSEVARRRLVAGHDVDPTRVEVIQHGAPANIVPRVRRNDPSRRPVILTWGLLGPGKGIEYAIDAVALLRDLDPAPRYLVLGETHPNIVRDSGETYRESLQALAVARGVEELVEFDGRYRDTSEILASVQEADVVLLPYLSRDQVVSGVLVEAIASARPVVSTAFPHAVELLAEGAGLVVPHEDPAAMAAALRSFLTDETAAARAAAAGRAQAHSLTWENVGRRYRTLTREVRGVRRATAS